MTTEERSTAINNLSKAWGASSSVRSALLGAGSIFGQVGNRVAKLTRLKAEDADVQTIHDLAAYLAVVASAMRGVLAAMSDLSTHDYAVQYDGYLTTIESEAIALANLDGEV